MQRLIPLATATALSIITMAPALSQQLQQQPTPLTTKPVTQSNGMGPALNQPTSAKRAEVTRSLDQRASSAAPISSTGPANETPANPAAPQADLARPTQPRRVLDAAGKPVEGAIQVSPDRVYDPQTGKYYQTTPRGQPH